MFSGSVLSFGLSLRATSAAKGQRQKHNLRLMEAGVQRGEEIQLDFISISVFSFVSGSSLGRRPSRGNGNKELRLQRIIRAAKLSNLSRVTPKTWVRPAPIRPPRTLPPLHIDIRVANRVASIPCGHILAASTRTGMKEA